MFQRGLDICRNLKAFGKLDILSTMRESTSCSPSNITEENCTSTTTYLQLVYKQFDLNVLGLILTSQEAAKHFSPVRAEAS